MLTPFDDAVETAKMAASMGNFGGSFDAETFEHAAKVMRGQGGSKNAATARKMLQMAEAMKRSPSGNTTLKRAQGSNFTFNIVRKTSAISGTLPVPFFGAVPIKSQYSKSLPLNLGNAATYDIVYGTATTREKIKFTFVDASNNTDIVELSCNETPITELMQNLLDDSIDINNFKFTLTSASYLSQYSVGWQLINRTTLGKQTNDTIIPSTYFEKDQFQSTILDVTVNNWLVTKNDYILGGIINSGSSGTEISYTINMSLNYIAK